MADALLLEGDKLALAGDRVSLEYGWWALRWLEGERNESRSDMTDAAYTYALNELTARHGQYMSREQIRDRIRVARHFPETRYKELKAKYNYPFSFSQLRACLVIFPETGEADAAATLKQVRWAAKNDATGAEIYAHKTGKPDAEASWHRLKRAAELYLERAADQPERRKVAAGAVLEAE